MKTHTHTQSCGTDTVKHVLGQRTPSWLTWWTWTRRKRRRLKSGWEETWFQTPGKERKGTVSGFLSRSSVFSLPSSPGGPASSLLSHLSPVSAQPPSSSSDFFDWSSPGTLKRLFLSAGVWIWEFELSLVRVGAAVLRVWAGSPICLSVCLGDTWLWLVHQVLQREHSSF